MDSLFQQFLALRQAEYIIIDRSLRVLQTSPQAQRWLENAGEMELGADIRLGFPELIGVESVLAEIAGDRQGSFHLAGIQRSIKAETQEEAIGYLDIYVLPNTDANAEAQSLVLILEDVTERMRLEQALTQRANESSLLLRQLTAAKHYIDQVLASMADMLLVTTTSGKIKTANTAVQNLLGYTEAELRGQQISSILQLDEQYSDSWIDEHFCERLDELLHEQLETSAIDYQALRHLPMLQDVEAVCYDRQRQMIPVAFSRAVIQTELAGSQDFVYIIRDHTVRKQLELAKQEFLAMISHEIRTPMTAVIGMTDILLNTSLTTRQQEYVRSIQESGDALLTIINDLLDLSKLEFDRLELEAYPFDLLDCVYAAIQLLATKAEQKGIGLVFHHPAMLPEMVVGDPVRLRQILINLLSNAIKFTEKGCVVVSAIVRSTAGSTAESTAESTATDRTADWEVEFAISDTGIGIPHDRLDRLFQSFSQVDAAVSRYYGGTGLGLAICKNLCEMMGGRIWVESQARQGSTFYFTVRLQDGETRSTLTRSTPIEELPAIEPTGPHGPLRILLAEDYPLNQKVVMLLLQQMGHQADLAQNGLEVLERLRSPTQKPADEPANEQTNEQVYDVVLMDVQMPHMDGLTATRHILEEWQDDRPYIIAMTAGAMVGDRDRCIAAGMDEYLTKPIRYADLEQALKQYQVSALNSSKPRSSTRTAFMTTQVEQNAHGDGTVNLGTKTAIETATASDPTTSKTDRSPETPAHHALSPQHVSSNPSLILDPSGLEEVRRIASFAQVDESAFVVETIDLYLADMPQSLTRMQQAIATQNAKTLRLVAHNLGTTGATLGAKQLTRLCRELETIAIREDFTQAKLHLFQVELEHQRVEQALRSERQKWL